MNAESKVDHAFGYCRLLPLLGCVATGVPFLALEYLERMIGVPGQIVGGAENAFLLRVQGDAMTGEGINPRDLVIVAPQSAANEGDLIIAMIGDDAILCGVKRTVREISLASSNPAYEPIKIVSEDARVIGKVIGLIRDYEGAAF